MIKFIKKNKLFSFVLIFSILTFIIGLLLPSMFNNDINKEITSNLNSYINTINSSKLTYSNIFFMLSCISISLPPGRSVRPILSLNIKSPMNITLSSSK